jgi:hypothetical protein
MSADVHVITQLLDLRMIETQSAGQVCHALAAQGTDRLFAAGQQRRNEDVNFVQMTGVEQAA